MPKGRDGKSYKKKTPVQHVLDRPESYIGSIIPETHETWYFKGGRMEYGEIEYAHGLYKIFDEVIVNAVDNVTRCREEGGEQCTEIRVDLDRETGRITVWNNGATVPVQKHDEEDVYLPEMVWSHMFTSDNYDDDKERKTGGKNGVGTKATNIFSTEFQVHLYDAASKQEYLQVFSENNSSKTDPEIKKGRAKSSWTEISFVPDYQRFGAEGMYRALHRLFVKRVYDITMVPGVKVKLDGEELKIKNLAKYTELFYPEGAKVKRATDLSDPEWQVCVVFDPEQNREMEHVSYVNGVCTLQGGTHVSYVQDQVVAFVRDKIAKTAKTMAVKPAMVKKALTVFLYATVVNPSFESQSKNKLSTRPTQFGVTWRADDKFLGAIGRSGVVN